MSGRSPMRRAASVVLWASVTALCLFMLGRGIWALQQPWGSTGEKVFGLVFFAGLAAFAAYELLSATISRIGDWVNEDVVYGLGSLVFVAGAVFVYLRGDGSTGVLLTAVVGALFFGAGAIMFLVRARRR